MVLQTQTKHIPPYGGGEAGDLLFISDRFGFVVLTKGETRMKFKIIFILFFQIFLFSVYSVAGIGLPQDRIFVIPAKSAIKLTAQNHKPGQAYQRVLIERYNLSHNSLCFVESFTLDTGQEQTIRNDTCQDQICKVRFSVYRRDQNAWYQSHSAYHDITRWLLVGQDFGGGPSFELVIQGID